MQLEHRLIQPDQLHKGMSPVRMEFGQSQEAPMTVVSTPSNNMAGNDQSSDEIGSVFIDGKLNVGVRGLTTRILQMEFLQRTS